MSGRRSYDARVTVLPAQELRVRQCLDACLPHGKAQPCKQVRTTPRSGSLAFSASNRARKACRADSSCVSSGVLFRRCGAIGPASKSYVCDRSSSAYQQRANLPQAPGIHNASRPEDPRIHIDRYELLLPTACEQCQCLAETSRTRQSCSVGDGERQSGESCLRGCLRELYRKKNLAGWRFTSGQSVSACEACSSAACRMETRTHV